MRRPDPRRWRRRRSTGLLALAVSLTAVLPTPEVRAAVPVLVVDGRGFGHGVGMSQDGAYWMGLEGASTHQILGHFYPGTGLGQGGGAVRVAVLSQPDRETVVTFADGGEIRSPRDGPQAPGFPVRADPGGSIRLRHDGETYWAEPISGATVSGQDAGPAVPARGDGSLQVQLPGTTSTTGSTTTTTAPGLLPSTTTTSTTAPPPPPAPGPSSTTSTTAAPPPPEGGAPPPASGASSPSPLWAVPAAGGTTGVPDRGARYRGLVEAALAGDALRLVNVVDVEDYLRGMGEIRDPRWPSAALEAQAVAARTYALRAMAASGEICDTQRCQVYLGQQAEYGAMDAAVAATRGQVLAFGGRLASAVYSASGGGVSATTEEGFGTPGAGYPYLRAAPYPTRDPRPWDRRIALADLARRLGYPGTLTDVRMGRQGPSGRALTVDLHGSSGARSVAGLALGAAVGARSTLWTLRIEQADAAPEPPPAEQLVQAPPEAVGEIVDSEVARVSRDGRAPGVRAILPAAPAGREAAPWPLRLALVAVLLAAGVTGAVTVRSAERRPGLPG